MGAIANIWNVIIRRLRMIRLSRNFLVFLVFLGISVVFWCIQTLQDKGEVDVEFSLSIVDVPSNVIFTSEVPENMSVKLNSKGWTALKYLITKRESHTLEINFNEVNTSKGVLEIDGNAIRRAVAKRTPDGFTFVSSKPSKIDVYYSNGAHKRVPIKFAGNVKTSEQRHICGIIFSPDSVDIYAPDNLYNRIQSISTEEITWEDVKDTINVKLALNAPQGVKVEPDSVLTRICVDLFTDMTVPVKILSENMPSNLYLRTFPQQVEVTCLVNSAHYNKLTGEDFLIVVDYKEIKENTTKLRVYLRQKPDFARNIRISPEYVEFVVEKEN